MLMFAISSKTNNPLNYLHSNEKKENMYLHIHHGLKIEGVVKRYSNREAIFHVH